MSGCTVLKTLYNKQIRQWSSGIKTSFSDFKNYKSFDTLTR